MNTDIKIYHRGTKTPRNTEIFFMTSVTQCLCGEYFCRTGFGQSRSEVWIMLPYHVERQMKELQFIHAPITLVSGFVKMGLKELSAFRFITLLIKPS